MVAGDVIGDESEFGSDCDDDVKEELALAPSTTTTSTDDTSKPVLTQQTDLGQIPRRTQPVAAEAATETAAGAVCWRSVFRARTMLPNKRTVVVDVGRGYTKCLPFSSFSASTVVLSLHTHSH